MRVVIVQCLTQCFMSPNQKSTPALKPQISSLDITDFDSEYGTECTKLALCVGLFRLARLKHY